TFSENGNTRVLALRSLARRHDDSSERLPKTHWVKRVSDHTDLKALRGIQGNISALLNSRWDINAASLQSKKKIVPVGLGRNDNGGIPHFQCNADELCCAIEQLSIISVKPYLVVRGSLFAYQFLICRSGTRQTRTDKLLPLQDRFYGRQ